MKRLSRCDAAEMRRFAQSLRADLPAVRAAFRLPWSNGQTEGLVKHLAVMAELHAQGRYDRMTDDLFRLTGKAPTSMHDFVKLHATEFGSGETTA
ncbi:hypothetical protein RA280_18750 [Cupriavidus sp. CV2]|uniref:hypothetical protein n=1 Tax=Cupriavidus ulmosensis TaxID=3065913 RepID=UPI00296B114F|nr:hypothetical protein [Cupriavidus sp. CV2]MDW3683747.1 hypothetical protein [Cupriavidus sp. CV2]